jgi:hypothetical protein
MQLAFQVGKLPTSPNCGNTPYRGPGDTRKGQFRAYRQESKMNMMINNNTMNLPVVQPPHRDKGSLGEMFASGVKAIAKFFQETSTRVALRREQRSRSNYIYLCSDRVKATFDIPPQTILKEVGFRGDRFRPLSVAEIVWLYKDSRTHSYFEGEIVDAIEAYIAAKRDYAQLP